MRDIELERKIAEEECCKITIDDMQKTFEKIITNDEYIPTFLKRMYDDFNAEFLEGLITKTVMDIAFFSAMIALRKANNMEIPDNI